MTVEVSGALSDKWKTLPKDNHYLTKTEDSKDTAEAALIPLFQDSFFSLL